MADHAACRRDIDRLLTHTSALQRALKDIQYVICTIDGETWEEVQEQRHPLWEALNSIDSITIRALTYQIERPAQTDGPAHNPEHCGCEAEIACLCPCWACNPPALIDGGDA